MLRRYFDHRSGRVVAALRLALILGFSLAEFVFPGRVGANATSITGPLIIGYGSIAAALLLLTWNNWWLNHWLARPAHAIDIFYFTMLATVTEDYISTPFFLFFVFLLMAAFKRFGWRSAVATAIIAMLLYGGAGVFSQYVGLASDRLDRLVLRRYYLFLMALAILWFAVNQADLLIGRRRGLIDPKLANDPDEDGMPALLGHVCQRMNAQAAFLLWSDPDEPWSLLERADAGGASVARLGPEGLEPWVAPDLAGHAFMASASQPRQLVMEGESLVMARVLTEPLAPALMAALQAHAPGADLLVVPVPADDRESLLVVAGIEGLCSDDLALADELAEELAAVINRLSLLDATARLAIGNARVALARDIHDSVLQTLAGAGFRLAALRQSLGTSVPAQATALMQELQDQLVRAQADVREHVSGLRDQPGRVDAAEALRVLVNRLELQWGLACEFDSGADPIELQASVVGECRQLVREMVANAARHGRARSVAIALRRNGRHLQLTCRDDGIGMAAAGAPEGAVPWSISERVAAMGGKLALNSSQAGTLVDINLQVQD